MNRPTVSRGLRAALLLAAWSFLLPSGVTPRLRADDKPPKGTAEPTKLAKDLIGTWVLVGTPDKVGEAPKSGGRLKFLTGSHWTITQADPDTGKVVFHHGGSYTLDGDSYTETVEYANESTADLIKKTFKFKIKVEGDTFTQVAVGADNTFTEVWKRAK